MKQLFQNANKIILAFIILNFVAIPGFSQFQNENQIKHKDPPTPIEAFFYNGGMNYQATAKKAFDSNARFNFFSLATYTTEFKNQPTSNRMVIEAQVSYSLKNGLGIMVGTDVNSVTGFSSIIGPQHSFASKKILAVTIVSFFLNARNDCKLFGLYEFKPTITQKFTMYNRVQLLYNKSLKDGLHNRSYLNIRSGIKYKAFVAGLGINFDQFGPTKMYSYDFGFFTRWEFK